MDMVLIPLICYLVLWFQYLTQNINNEISFYQIIWPIFLLAFIFYPISGQYNGILRYLGSFSLYTILIRNLILILTLSIFGFLFKTPVLPIRSLILLWLLMSFVYGAFRFILRDLLVKYKSYSTKNITKVVIYGAGAAGVQLAASLRLNNNYSILAFIDDSKDLWDRTINGLNIYSPQFLLKNNRQIDV